MKKIIASLLMLILAVVLSVSVFAEVQSSPNIPMANKLPMNTPNFVPEIDGVKDAGYTVDTPVIANNVWGSLHSTTVTISTAWNENTLYFYIYVPDVTRQENTDNLWMSQQDGVWFLLDFFAGDRDVETFAKTQKTVRTFKIRPALEDVTLISPVHEDYIKPVNVDDLMYKVVWDDNGYAMEVAYTVPTDLSTLVANQEIIFDVEVFDVNSGTNYRYHINNTDGNSVENYCTAWSAKLVLNEAPAVEEPPVEEPAPETADAALSLAIVAVVAAAATGVVLKKKHF